MGASHGEQAVYDKMGRLPDPRPQGQGLNSDWGYIVGESPHIVGMRTAVDHRAVGRTLGRYRGRFGENKVIAMGMAEAEGGGMLPDEKRLNTGRPGQGKSQRELSA